MPKLSDRTTDEGADQHEGDAGKTRSGPRRRRRQIGNGDSPPAPEAASPAAISENAARRKVRHQQHWNNPFSHFGLFSAFRPYLFVAGIVVILAFLLYNESIIDDFEDQEKEQVALYAQLLAFGVSDATNNKQMGVIFHKVIKPSDFPMVVTDYWGEITTWKGEGLPDPGDWSPESMALLKEMLQQMDAKREPIRLMEPANVDGILYHGVDGFVITDTLGAIVGWRGIGLPASGDTSSSAARAVEQASARMDHQNSPMRLTVAYGSYSYLHHDESNFIITDNKGKLVTWWGSGLPEQGDGTQSARKLIREIMISMDVANDPFPFQIPSKAIQYFHYGDSELVSRISWANFGLMGILILFLLVGYVGFRNIRRSEQRSIWVGMAKETAHQLGTPLSSVSGWLELIRSDFDKATPGDPAAAAEQLGSIEVKVREMEHDLKRLNQIALRFSQIGSVPELEMTDINSVLRDTVAYFQSRGPQFGRVDLDLRAGDVPDILLNRELISWAFENLCKNGIDAIGNKAGRISVIVGSVPEKGLVQITVQDNGRGIEPDHVDQVFEPGFSTKKRGWGLGLAFVKRIIEEYHNGRISVTQSAPGEGTTFEVLLPLE